MRRVQPHLIVPIALLLGGAAGTGYFADNLAASVSAPIHAVARSTSSACNVKGNVSINSGERIYHVPGQKYYERTVVRPEYGERWFCSETEARAAGWRKSGV
ncbi:sunset domain-containing protein [Mesorhizobium sp. A623]